MIRGSILRAKTELFENFNVFFKIELCHLNILFFKSSKYPHKVQVRPFFGTHIHKLSTQQQTLILKLPFVSTCIADVI